MNIAAAANLLNAAQKIQDAWDSAHEIARTDDSLAAFKAIEAEREVRHRERLREYKRQSPVRERAEAILRAAHARRRAELGITGEEPIPILAAGLWAQPPERNPIF